MTLSATSSARTLGSCLTLVFLALGLQGCRKKNAAPPAQAPTAAPSAAAAAPSAAKADAPPALPAPTLIKDIGLQTPESVLYDAANDLYLVSNINGGPGDKDDNGFISRIAPDGTVAALKWIDGSKADVNLNAPKGMAIANGKLYVADIDFVRVFDAKTGKSVGKAGVPQATFLNDVAAGPDGTVYVSDSGVKAGKSGFEPTGTDAVYQIGKDGQAKPLLKDTALKSPNGIFADDSGVWVNSYGSKELYQVTGGKKENTVELPTGGLDGLVRLPSGTVLVSSWEGSTVYQGNGGKFTALISNLKTPADFGYDSKRGQLVIPLFTDNSLVIQPLPASLTAAAPAAPTATPAPAAAPAAPAAPAAAPAKAAAAPAKPAAPAAPATPATPAAPASSAPATPAKAAPAPAKATPAAPAAPSAKAATPAPAAPATPATPAKPADPAAPGKATPPPSAAPTAPAAPSK